MTFFIESSWFAFSKEAPRFLRKVWPILPLVCLPGSI